MTRQLTVMKLRRTLLTVRFLVLASGLNGQSTPNALLLVVTLFKSELAFVRLVCSAKERA